MLSGVQFICGLTPATNVRSFNWPLAKTIRLIIFRWANGRCHLQTEAGAAGNPRREFFLNSFTNRNRAAFRATAPARNHTPDVVRARPLSPVRSLARRDTPPRRDRTSISSRTVGWTDFFEMIADDSFGRAPGAGSAQGGR